MDLKTYIFQNRLIVAAGRKNMLRCQRCGANIPESQATNLEGKVLCEDCCFDLLNPPKACDPLAVSSTLSIRKQLGQKGTDGLSQMQKLIYDTVVHRGEISKDELMSTLHLTPESLEREFAVLRHCELLRAFKKDSKVYFVKY
ncbi:MAG: hypothetical protein NWE98_08795 [Candidatus Bathyarchaeota archaeon]|nr:hypothetical protein [Candidatus Bathyarchaeota archaeon]